MYRGIRYLIQITGVAIFVAAPFCISGADYIHKASIKTKHSQREAKILEKKIERKAELKSKKTDFNGLNGKKYESKSERYNFTIRGYKISGNNHLSTEKIASYIEPFRGKIFTREIEIKILKDISTAYNEIGLPYSFVKQIVVNKNNLDIRIIEGHINEINYDKRFDNDPLFKHYIQKLKELKPYNKKVGRYYFELLKKRPGIHGNLEIVTRILTPVRNINSKNPAAVNVTIKNLYHGVTGVLEINNRQRVDHSKQIKSTSYDEPIVEYQGSNYAKNVTNFNNMFGKGEKITVAYITSGDKEDQAVGLSVSYPIGFKGQYMFTDFNYNDSQVNNEQRILYGTVGYNHPLYIDYDHELNSKIAFQKYREQQKQYVAQNKKVINITKAVLGLDYQYNSYTVDFAYHQSLAHAKEHNASDEFGAPKNFNKYTLGADFVFGVPYGLDLTYRFDGQYSKNDLYFAEVFSAGVYQGGRGFTSSEIFGDKGISNSFELSKTFHVDDHPLLAWHREYVYIDSANVWSNRPDQYKAKTGRITSVGIGSEFGVVDNITFNVELSKPVAESIKGDPSLRKKKPATKVYAGMEYAYMF